MARRRFGERAQSANAREIDERRCRHVVFDARRGRGDVGEAQLGGGLRERRLLVTRIDERNRPLRPRDCKRDGAAAASADVEQAQLRAVADAASPRARRADGA
jgi:hypothetical protein